MVGNNQRKAPRHPPKEHATGSTTKGFVFLYCPKGNIFSWSPDDVKYGFCAYCNKSMNEIKSEEI